MVRASYQDMWGQYQRWEIVWKRSFEKAGPQLQISQTIIHCSPGEVECQATSIFLTDFCLKNQLCWWDPATCAPIRSPKKTSGLATRPRSTRVVIATCAPEGDKQRAKCPRLEIHRYLEVHLSQKTVVSGSQKSQCVSCIDRERYKGHCPLTDNS